MPLLQTERAQFLVECLDLPKAAEVEDAQWEEFQIAHLNDDSTFRIEDKSRQIAWSFTTAAEAVACAALYAQSTIFVSINYEEAKEKVRYARRIWDNLGIGGLPGIVKDNELGLEFTNGARLLSLPSRPPRGKARMNIVLDEFAHVQHDQAIYTAAIPIISKGGRLRIGSSPMGAGGAFWEISRQELRAYPGYNRVRTPWWRVRAFCKGRKLPIGAEALATRDRVERYGNDRIRLIFENMALDDFQQEYECVFVDETIAYFTWELIRSNQDDTLLHWHIKSVEDVIELVGDIKSAIAEGLVEPVLVGGVDIGRKKHLTEIILAGMNGGKIPARVMVSLDRVKFDAQEKCIRVLLNVLPIAGLLIDQNGIGMQLAENLEEDTIAEGIDFTNPSKALWASELKIQMERSNVPMPPNKDLAYQIHSVKRKISDAKHAIFDVDANEKHHGDKMWALALAVWAAREYGERPVVAPLPQWERR